jgi:hypothetical protein
MNPAADKLGFQARAERQSGVLQTSPAGSNMTMTQKELASSSAGVRDG